VPEAREVPEESIEASRGARPQWSGRISFGLVSVPVHLFPASRAGGTPPRMLGAEGTPLARRFFCPEHGREIGPEEIVRGYELEDGRHVVVQDEELEALEPKKSRDIDLERFVPAGSIDPLFFERGYFLAPDGENTKAYRLLAEAMADTRRVGIGTFVMRDREYWVAIFAERGLLRAETLRFPEEIRDVRSLLRNGRPRPKPADVRRLERAVAALEAPKLDERKLADRETARMLELVQRKLRAGKDVVRTKAAAEEEPQDNVIDLMQVLKQSMRGGKRLARRAEGSKRRSPRRSGS
jgi:DNA end-binding protein Ku